MKAHPVLFEVEGRRGREEGGGGRKKFEEHFLEMTSNASYFYSIVSNSGCSCARATL